MERSLMKTRAFKDSTDVISYLGDFGRFQRMLTACFFVMVFPVSYPMLYMYFATLNPMWRCTLNSTVCLSNATLPNTNKERCTMGRGDWQFTEPKSYSIFTQFDIYCDSEWLVYLATSIIFIGWGPGAIILGWVADRYGRKTVLFPSTVMVLLAGFVSAFSPNIYALIVIRFVLGFFIPGTSLQMFVLLSEFVSTARRPLAVTLMWFGYSTAICTIGLKGYFIREWKMLAIALTAPYLVVLPLFLFIPESTRWLHIHGKTDDMLKVFHRIAYWNKKELPADFTVPQVKSDNEHAKIKASYKDVFRTRRMAIQSVAQGYGWMVNGMVYYGLALAADDLGGSLYLNYVLVTLAEYPANVLTIILCDQVGRKKSTMAAMALGGISCVIVAFLPKTGSIGYFRIAAGIFGKFCITISFNIIYTWSVEIYPTNIRAEGMGYLQVTSRIGATTSPFIAKSLKTIHPAAPFIVMGSLSIIASLVCAFLPETKDKPMEDINDGNCAPTEEGANCAMIREPIAGDDEQNI